MLALEKAYSHRESKLVLIWDVQKKTSCNMSHCECDNHTVGKILSRVSQLLSYIKTAQPVLKLGLLERTYIIKDSTL